MLVYVINQNKNMMMFYNLYSQRYWRSYRKVGDLEFQGHVLTLRCWCALFWIPWPKEYECRHQEHLSMIHFLRYTEGHMEKVSDLGFQGHRSITFVIHSYKTYFHDLCTIPVPTRCDLCLSGFFLGSGYFKLASWRIWQF